MVGFIILFHKSPEQLDRLIENLDPDENPIVVHICKNYKGELPAYIENKVKVLDQRFYGDWGEFGIVRASLEAANWLVKNRPEITHVSLHSGSDFPIKPIKKYVEYLSNNRKKSFISYWPYYSEESGFKTNEDTPWVNNISFQRKRIEHYHIRKGNIRYIVPPYNREGYTNMNFFQKIKHFLKAVLLGKRKHSILWEVYQFYFSLRLPFPRKIPLKNIYGGSQWWTLSKEHLKIVYNFYESNRDINNFFSEILLSDEKYIQTCLLKYVGSKGLVNNNLRLIEFDNSPHPKTYTLQDWDQLIASKKFFARKFDEIESKSLLSKLESEVLKGNHK